MKKYFFFLLISILFISCSKNSDSPVESQIPDLQNRKYVYYPPESKPPCPHHNPAYSKIQYDSLMSQLFIINNFGQWQGSSDEKTQYFHDGIDIVLPNGTKIFAVQKGCVKYIDSRNQYYSVVCIEDYNKPGYVWFYVHVYNFRVHEGDSVKQGDFLATVNLQGVEHTHLIRAIHINGKPWNSFSSYQSIDPIHYFNYDDTEPPVIKTPFYFFKDQTDSLISNSLNPTINGKVDIVAGIRDQGIHARGPAGSSLFNFGDRLCISHIEYEIKHGNIEDTHKSFDFSKLAFVNDANQYKQVEIAYKSIYLIEGTITNWNKIFNYFIITNWKDKDAITVLSNEDSAQCWDSNELKPDGTKKYPNGSYTLTVTAYDSNGNSTKQEQIVTINN